jgi:guanylate kinase
MTALCDRLLQRGTETKAAVEKRLAAALHEIQYAKKPNSHDFIIVNDDLDRAYDLFQKVALGERITGDTLPCLD